jgi:hypothetical protein
MNMADRRIRVRRKREIRESIEKSLLKDADSLDDIGHILDCMIDYCVKHEVSPETLLVQLNGVREVAEQEYARRYSVSIVGNDEMDISRKDQKRMEKGLDRDLKEISKFRLEDERPRGMEVRRKAAPVIDAAPVHEGAPYKCSDERQNYIQ